MDRRVRPDDDDGKKVGDKYVRRALRKSCSSSRSLPPLLFVMPRLDRGIHA